MIPLISWFYSQGIIVLSRQWKNSLYNPILFEHQYKNKLTRPINVTFSFPQNEEECEDPECEGDNDLGAYAGVGDNPEESENALLLGQTQHHRTHIGIFLINALFHFEQLKKLEIFFISSRLNCILFDGCLNFSKKCLKRFLVFF